MTRIEITTREMIADRAAKVLAAWEAENVSHTTRFEYVKDVKLGNGKVLPNRKLTKVLHVLKNGRTVEIKCSSRTDGVTQNHHAHYYAVEFTN